MIFSQSSFIDISRDFVIHSYRVSFKNSSQDSSRYSFKNSSGDSFRDLFRLSIIDFSRISLWISRETPTINISVIPPENYLQTPSEYIHSGISSLTSHDSFGDISWIFFSEICSVSVKDSSKDSISNSSQEIFRDFPNDFSRDSTDPFLPALSLVFLQRFSPGFFYSFIY